MIYLAWSGGLDSTFALYDLLRRGYAVHAHHVHYHYGLHRFAKGEERALLAANRVKAEAQACKEIREHLAALGLTFEYSETGIDMGADQVRIGDELNIMPHVLNRALVVGVEETDRLVFGSNIMDYDGYPPEQRWRQMIALHCGWAKSAEPIIVRYARRGSLKEHTDLMGPELSNLVMSCRRPRFEDGEWIPCGSTKPFHSRWSRQWPSPRPCTCWKLIDLIPRYAEGWAKDEADEP